MSVFTDLDLGSSPNDGTGTTLRAGGTIINANNALAANQTEDNEYSGDNNFNGFFGIGAPLQATIATGVLTVINSNIFVIGQGGGADNLDTISTSPSGTILALRADPSSGTITVTETDNIGLDGTTRVLDSARDILFLLSAGTVYREISFANNQ